ncbi:MAG: DUF883 family protein [Deltaproteobacteria bacterium]|nr:DUF883 family protein [Deltaproteobacteria bacterium]
MKAIEAKEASNGTSLANAAGERAKGYVDVGVDTWNGLSRQAIHIGRKADGYVRENPWWAIGAAAGVGIAIGLLLRRPHRA